MRSTRDIKDLVSTNRLGEPSGIIKRKQDQFTVATSAYTQGTSFAHSAEVPNRTANSFKDRTQSMINEANFRSLKMPPANGTHAPPFSITGSSRLPTKSSVLILVFCYRF